MITKQSDVLRFSRIDLKRAFRKKPGEEVGPYDFAINRSKVEQADVILFIDDRRCFIVKNKLGRIGEVTGERAEQIWNDRSIGDAWQLRARTLW